MPADRSGPRSISRQQFGVLATQAQDYIDSLPSDDLLAHLMIDIPSMETPPSSHASSTIGLAAWPTLAGAGPPKKASLQTALMILIEGRMKGDDHAKLRRKLTAIIRSGAVEPMDPSYQDALIEMADHYEAGDYAFTLRGFCDFFADLHGHRILYCRDNRRTYVYSDGIWIENRGDMLEALVKDTVKSLRGADQIFGKDEAKQLKRLQRSLEGRGVPGSTAEDMRSQSRLWTAQSDLDAEPFLLNLPNGTYELEADRFRAHAPADHLTRMSPVAYDKDAKCPNFRRMVSDLFLGDQDTTRYVQRVLGYCLCGDASAKRFWVFYGPRADNGKSTLLRVMKAVLGDELRGYYGSMYFDTLMSKRTDTKNLGIASLDYKPRVVVVDELPKECCLNAGIVKAITGDTTGLSARRNFQDPTTHEVTYKLLIATNHLPTFDSFDEGIKNRITVIPFNQKFARVKDFDQRWVRELPGILNWLIEGFREYGKTGLDQLPPAVKMATCEAVGRSDSFGRFLSESTELADGQVTRVNDLREAYRAWLTAHAYPDSVGPKDMSKLLKSHGYKPAKSNANGLGGVMAVKGLRLRTPDNR